MSGEQFATTAWCVLRATLGRSTTGQERFFYQFERHRGAPGDMSWRSDIWSTIDRLRRKLAGRFRPMTAAELREHIYKTYFFLRSGLAALALAFPLLLLLYGWWHSIPIQSSLSDYYFAFAPPNTELRVFPERVMFVGILFAIGSFLVLYKGLNRTEDWALNITGASAIIIALFPTSAPDYCKNCGSSYPNVHYTAGVVLFVCMAFVAWACSEISLGHLPPKKRQWYRHSYDILATLMIVGPVGAIGVTYIFRVADWRILALEWAGIWAFALYWIVKTHELSMNNGEVEKALAQIAPSPTAEEKELGERKLQPEGKPSLRQKASNFLG